MSASFIFFGGGEAIQPFHEFILWWACHSSKGTCRREISCCLWSGAAGSVQPAYVPMLFAGDLFRACSLWNNQPCLLNPGESKSSLRILHWCFKERPPGTTTPRLEKQTNSDEFQKGWGGGEGKDLLRVLGVFRGDVFAPWIFANLAIVARMIRPYAGSLP